MVSILTVPKVSLRRGYCVRIRGSDMVSDRLSCIVLCMRIFMTREIFRDTRCGRGLGMHRGIFALTSEPVEEQPEKPKEALKVKGRKNGSL